MLAILLCLLVHLYLYEQTTVLARDQRIPEKTGTAQITINVKYDDYPPVIDNQVNGFIEQFISENIEVGTSVARITAVDQDIIEDGEVGFLF